MPARAIGFITPFGWLFPSIFYNWFTCMSVFRGMPISFLSAPEEGVRMESVRFFVIQPLVAMPAP